MNFRRLGSFDYLNIAEELATTKFWNWLNLRRSEGLNHDAVQDIVLRFQSVEGAHTVNEYFDKLECVDYFPQRYLPHTMQIVNRFAEGRTVGRIVVAKMQPFRRIATHVDEGAYCAAHDRFHFVVKSNPEIIFKCNDEQLHMPTGEIWWLDNKSPHEVINASAEERIHVIVDLLK